MEDTCQICLEILHPNLSPIDLVKALTDDEPMPSQASTWKCKACSSNFHIKCLGKWFKTQKYTNIACPACKRQLSLREAEEILNITAFESYVTSKLIDNYNSFIKANSNLIHRYIAIKECIDRYKEIAFLRILHDQIEEIIFEYKQYRAWREFDSEAQSMTEEAEEKLDEFDKTCALFTITTRPIENVSVNLEIFRQIISSLKSNIFILSTNIKLPIQAIKLVRSYLNDLEGNEIYKNSLMFSINELELMSSSKTPYTLLTKLREIHKNTSRTIVCPCSQCGGCVIKEMERCELCFTRYCLRCLQPWATDHVCDENVVGDVEYMLANTRPCPNCGVRIAKTKDCNHMFCTHCFITYDWETGEIITQNVPNPYRDEWIKKHGGEAVTLIDAIEVRDKESDTNRRLAIERISLYIDYLPTTITTSKPTTLITATTASNAASQQALQHEVADDEQRGEAVLRQATRTESPRGTQRATTGPLLTASVAFTRQALQREVVKPGPSLRSLLAFIINSEKASSSIVEKLERKILTRTITLDKSRRKPIQRQYYASVKGKAMLVDMNTMLLEILKAAAIENSEYEQVVNLCLHAIASFANRFLVITDLINNSFTIRTLLDGSKRLYHLIWSFVVRGLEMVNDLSKEETIDLKRTFAFPSPLTDIEIV